MCDCSFVEWSGVGEKWAIQALTLCADAECGIALPKIWAPIFQDSRTTLCSLHGVNIATCITTSTLPMAI